MATKFTGSYEVVQRKDDANAWGVEAIDPDEGAIYMAIFSGPNARDRAFEYAEFKSRAALARAEGRGP